MPFVFGVCSFTKKNKKIKTNYVLDDGHSIII